MVRKVFFFLAFLVFILIAYWDPVPLSNFIAEGLDLLIDLLKMAAEMAAEMAESLKTYL